MEGALSNILVGEFSIIYYIFGYHFLLFIHFLYYFLLFKFLFIWSELYIIWSEPAIYEGTINSPEIIAKYQNIFHNHYIVDVD